MRTITRSGKKVRDLCEAAGKRRGVRTAQTSKPATLSPCVFQGKLIRSFPPHRFEGTGCCPPGDTSVTAGTAQALAFPCNLFSRYRRHRDVLPTQGASAGSKRDLQRAACAWERAAGSTPGRDGRHQQDRSWSRSGSESCPLALQDKRHQAPYMHWCEPKPLFPQRHTRTQLIATCAPLNPLQNTQSWMSLRTLLVINTPLPSQPVGANREQPPWGDSHFPPLQGRDRDALD